MGGKSFQKLVCPKGSLESGVPTIGVASNHIKAKCWCGTAKAGMAQATPAILHSPLTYVFDISGLDLLFIYLLYLSGFIHTRMGLLANLCQYR